MIRVTQGHERGVGLEIFLKAISCLPKNSVQNFLLYAEVESLERVLAYTFPKAKITSESLKFGNLILPLRKVSGSLAPTSNALYAALDETVKEDILLTLPSSKEKITLKDGSPAKGHTDLFRLLYPNDSAVMSFISPRLNALLLTDHVGLKEVEDHLSGGKAAASLRRAIKRLKGIRNIEKVFFSGVNPHCGEGGLISSFDKAYGESLLGLKSEFPNIQFYGPLSGDTILFNRPCSNILFVFAFHDQALAPFKLANGLTGINLTLGLPFKRVSVDHGTAFDLFGKNEANYQGMFYLLDEIAGWK